MAERRARRPAGEGWTDPDLAATAEMLQRQYGLVYTPNRVASVEDAMRRVMTSLRIPSARVLRERATTSAEVQDALVGQLTIGETYFFRERGQLDYLRRELLPGFARATDAAPSLRCWSAGCSTGEEPYSLAILLREAAWPHGASVLGTDLVPARLAHARRGRYGKWSMRGLDEELLARWFRPQGSGYLLDASVRSAVEFRVLDLVRDDYATVGATAMDVIFCRNVLIYFDPPVVRHVAERLLAALAPRGWLFLSATDPVLSDVVACHAVPTGAGFAYRRLDAPDVPRASRHVAVPVAAPPSDPLAPAPPRPTPARRPATPLARTTDPPPSTVAPDDAETAYAAGDHDRAAALAQAALAAGDDREAIWLVLVRALGNRGRLADAGQACAAALGRHPLSARLATVHATLLLRDGRATDAAAAARRSLYLDGQAPVTHLVLGDALARVGDPVGAARAFENAAELLGALPPDAPVPDADGEPARRLFELARFRARAPGAGPGR